MVIDNLEEHNKYLQTTVQKYVEYMAEVAKGKLDTFLTIKEKKDDLLIMLGKQLNDTTTHLKMRIEQIQGLKSKGYEKILVMGIGFKGKELEMVW